MDAGEQTSGPGRGAEEVKAREHVDHSVPGAAAGPGQPQLERPLVAALQAEALRRFDAGGAAAAELANELLGRAAPPLLTAAERAEALAPWSLPPGPLDGLCERHARRDCSTCSDNAEPDLLTPLDPFARLELRANVEPDLEAALEVLLAAEAGDLALAQRASIRKAIERLAAEPGAPPERTPLQQTCDDIAAVLLEGVLAAGAGRRAEAANLLRAVARFAARGPAALPGGESPQGMPPRRAA